MALLNRTLMLTVLGLLVCFGLYACQNEAPDAGEEVMINPTIEVKNGGWPCRRGGGRAPFFLGWPDGDFVGWTSDEFHIIFDDGTRVMKVNVEGTRTEHRR